MHSQISLKTLLILVILIPKTTGGIWYR